MFGQRYGYHRSSGDGSGNVDGTEAGLRKADVAELKAYVRDGGSAPPEPPAAGLGESEGPGTYKHYKEASYPQDYVRVARFQVPAPRAPASRDSGAPLLPAIAEHPPGPNTESRSLGGRVEWGAEWDAGWRGDSSWQEDAAWRGDSSWQEWRGGWWYRDASGDWVEWQNPWRVQAHMPA